MYESPNTTDNTYDAGEWYAGPFSESAEVCVTGIHAHHRDSGNSRTITAEIWTEVAGSPGAIYDAGMTGTLSDIPDAIAATENLFAATETLPIGSYWIVLQPGGGAVGIGRQASGGTTDFKYSTNSGSSWGASGSSWEMSVLGCE